jgi:hypothetical protein
MATDIEQLVVRMATENPTWGYTRLVGALDNLGHQIGPQHDQGCPPTTRPRASTCAGKRMPWKTFLRTHLGAIAAADFFSVEVLQTRRVQIGGVVRQPYGPWMKQVARNLADDLDGFLIGKRYLLHDRDPLFTGESGACLRQRG